MTLFGNWLGGKISRNSVGAEAKGGRGREEIKLEWNWDRLWLGGNNVHRSRIFIGKKRQVVAESGRVYSLGRGHVTGRNDKSSEKLRRTKN